MKSTVGRGTVNNDLHVSHASPRRPRRYVEGGVYRSLLGETAEEVTGLPPALVPVFLDDFRAGECVERSKIIALFVVSRSSAARVVTILLFNDP